MSDDPLHAFRGIDAYTLADGARRCGLGGVIHELRPQTRASVFVGRAVTARIQHEPNRDVPVKDYGGWKLHDRAGAGDVAVLDGSGLYLTAMGALAITNLKRRGAAAAVVNACVRDVEEMDDLGLPVFAVGTGITTVAGHGFVTDLEMPVTIHGVRIATGDLIAGCRGGIVVVPWDERERVLAETLRILDSDRVVREGIKKGQAVGALWHQAKKLDD